MTQMTQTKTLIKLIKIAGTLCASVQDENSRYMDLAIADGGEPTELYLKNVIIHSKKMHKITSGYTVAIGALLEELKK